VNVTAESLSVSEHIKLGLLSEGLAISPSAQDYIDARNANRPMTPADYASTSGIILRIDGSNWVNAPIALYNPNFVDHPGYLLDLGDNGLVVTGEGLEATAEFWLPPDYHGKTNEHGEAYNSYAFTHGDRVRVSPIEGCAMHCHFCDLPYEFKYRTKRIEGIVDSVQVALTDPLQRAGHVLISGGTPHEEDFDYVQQCYQAVITGFAPVPVDIMMVPAPGLLDVEWLASIGVHQLSINLEIYDATLARRIMRRKAELTQAAYLDFIEHATTVLGAGRVRSMLMVGVEPLESTLLGVRAIAERGGVPVLSPFRPDPSTPMAKALPPTSAVLREAYLRAREIAIAVGSDLGPDCLPCSHNTLTFAQDGIGTAFRAYRDPVLV